jgi:hypothetical protein
MARTIKLYRIESGGRRLAAGAIRASSQDDPAAHWQLFLATAAQGLYVANYRGVQLGTALVTAAGKWKWGLEGMAKARIPAIAYLRTSSAANVGADRDSDTRQRAAIEGFAKRAGFELVGEFYDAAASGKDPIEGRPGFKALLDRVVGNGVRVVIVEGQPVCPAPADPGGRHFVAGRPRRASPNRRRRRSYRQRR